MSMIEAPPIARREQEFAAMVREHDGTVTGTVNQAIAAWMLALNTGNRPRSDRQVARFEKILTEGRWRNTGEPIIISRQGVLNDGQHRLTAILKTGIPAVCDVRFGVDRDAFVVTGTAAPRTAAQVSAMLGVKNAAVSASIGRILHQYDHGRMGCLAEKVDNDVVVAMIDRNPEIAMVTELGAVARFSPARSSPFLAMMAVALRTSPHGYVKEFMEIAGGRMCDDEQHPAHLLYVRLRDAAIARTRFSHATICALTARAWNMFAVGERKQFLRILDSDTSNDGFPKLLTYRHVAGAAA